MSGPDPTAEEHELVASIREVIQQVENLRSRWLFLGRQIGSTSPGPARDRLAATYAEAAGHLDAASISLKGIARQLRRMPGRSRG